MDEQIKIIVDILQENEESLSDGYGYYCGRNKVEQTLVDIAGEILDRLEIPLETSRGVSRRWQAVIEQLIAQNPDRLSWSDIQAMYERTNRKG